MWGLEVRDLRLPDLCGFASLVFCCWAKTLPSLRNLSRFSRNLPTTWRTESSLLALHEHRACLPAWHKLTPSKRIKTCAAMPSGKHSEAAASLFELCQTFWALGWRASLPLPGTRLSWQRGRELSFQLALYDSDILVGTEFFRQLGKESQTLNLSPSELYDKNLIVEFIRLTPTSAACRRHVGWRGEAPERTGSFC